MTWQIGDLPEREDLCPGAVFRHKGSVVALYKGKHGNGDLRIEVNGRPISHRLFAVLFMALYCAEERYLDDGGQGGDYLVGYIHSWAKRVRGQNDLFEQNGSV